MSGESDPSFPFREAELELLIKLIDEATTVQAQEQLRAFYGSGDISMWYEKIKFVPSRGI